MFFYPCLLKKERKMEIIMSVEEVPIEPHFQVEEASV